MLGRRQLLKTGSGLLAAGAGLGVPANAPVVEIRMRSDPEGAEVGFDPIGLLLRPGQTVRWVCEANYHTTTAYHPANGGRSLRIPRTTIPWNSGILGPGQHFEIQLLVAGVYDYCCLPHEEAGMVGRLVVGQPGGPGSQPFDWYRGTREGADWLPVPEAARSAFPSVDAIMRTGVVLGKAMSMQH